MWVSITGLVLRTAPRAGCGFLPFKDLGSEVLVHPQFKGLGFIRFRVTVRVHSG